MSLIPGLKTMVDTLLLALGIIIPVVVALFIITKALDRQAEIRMLIGEGILAVIGLELLFVFLKSTIG